MTFWREQRLVNKINSFNGKHLDTAVVGSGPAGVAFAHHYQNSPQKDIHHLKWITGKKGIQLPQFQTWSNSLSKEDFFDVFRTYGVTPVIDSQRNTYITENNNYLALYKIFAIIEEYGKYIYENLSKSEKSQSDVKKIIVKGNPEESPDDILYTIANNRGEIEGTFEQVILATGAKQEYSPILQNYGEKLFLTQDLLLPGGIQKIFDKIEQNPNFKIVIAGNSHSAFSTCHKFFIESKKRGVPLQDGQIEILSPSPVRIYYENIQEAIADGYEFDPILDICPKTGRVYRFGGSRVYAGEIAKKTVKATKKNIPFPVKIKYVNPNQKEYQDSLENSSCLIQAFGEKAIVPHIENENGTIYKFSGKITNNTRELIFQNGIILPELHGLGFGFGIQSDEIGEPSYIIRNGKIVFFADYASQNSYSEIMAKISY